MQLQRSAKNCHVLKMCYVRLLLLIENFYVYDVSCVVVYFIFQFMLLSVSVIITFKE